MCAKNTDTTCLCQAALSAIQGMLDRMPARPQSVHLNADQTVSSSNSEQTALLQIFATVLEDEVAACSALVDEVSTSLTELLRQYQGSARQSPELQQLALAIQSNTVSWFTKSQTYQQVFLSLITLPMVSASQIMWIHRVEVSAAAMAALLLFHSWQYA